MDWKVVFGTFGLIFLAELGDKTQLTALAFSAGSRSTWSVFAGAAAALVCSTFVAVLLGSLMRDQSLVPMSLIKLVAGCMFLLFGVLTLREVLFPAAEVEGAVEEAAELGHKRPSDGILASVALASAAGFESAALSRYRALAAAAENQELRSLWSHLADEERQHLDRVKGLQARHAEELLTPPPVVPSGSWPFDTGAARLDGDTLRQLIEEENATARFYQGLAESAGIHSLRRAFLSLAKEELSHVEHLRELL